MIGLVVGLLISTKPLSRPVLAYSQWDSSEHIRVKFPWISEGYQSWNAIGQCIIKWLPSPGLLELSSVGRKDNCQMRTRALIQYKDVMMISYQYRKSHCGDKTILRPSLHNGISYTGKMTSLYWIRALLSVFDLGYQDYHCGKRIVDKGRDFLSFFLFFFNFNIRFFVSVSVYRDFGILCEKKACALLLPVVHSHVPSSSCLNGLIYINKWIKVYLKTCL